MKLRQTHQNDEKVLIQSTTSWVKNGRGSVMGWTFRLLLLDTDYVTADRNSKLNSEAYRSILSARIQPTATKLMGHRFTVRMDCDHKPIAEATFWRQDLLCSGQVSHLMSLQQTSFPFIKDKTESRNTQMSSNWRPFKVSPWRKIWIWWMWPMGSRCQAVIDCKVYSSRY